MHKFLKKYYFINKFDTKYIDKQDKNTTIIYRDYNTNTKIAIITKIRNYCKRKSLRFILANDIKLAIYLDLDGVYLPSFYRGFNHLAYSLKKKFLIIGSAHNLKEIRIKEIQNIKTIFLSSIFKKNKNYLGINRFKNIGKLTKLRTVALGGIKITNYKKILLTNSKEFAGISYFE